MQNRPPLNPSPHSFMQQNERKNIENPKSERKKSPVVECLDGPARITSKELAPIHSVISGTLQNACSTCPKSGCRFGKSALMHIDRLMNSLPKGPKRMMTKGHDRPGRPDVKRDTCHEVETRTCWTSIIEYTTIGVASFRAAEVVINLTEELRHAETIPTCKIHESCWHVTQKFEDQNPSLGMICPGELHQRSPNAPKFEDRSQEGD